MTDGQQDILKIVTENPGIHFRDIMRKSGISSGMLNYHLKKMVNDNVVRAIRVGARQTAYSSMKITEKQLIVAWALRRRTPRAILLALAANNGCRFADLIAYSKKSPATVSSSLSNIIRNELVVTKKSDSKKRYYINCRTDLELLVRSYGRMFN